MKNTYGDIRIGKRSAWMAFLALSLAFTTACGQPTTTEDENTSASAAASSVQPDAAQAVSSVSESVQAGDASAASSESVGDTAAEAYEGYLVTITKANSWPDGDRTAYQMSATFQNRTAEKLDRWEFRVDAGAEISVTDFWNCELTQEGTMLQFAPADYNAVVEAGASVDDIGVIFSTDADVDLDGMYAVDAQSKDAMRLSEEERLAILKSFGHGAAETAQKDDAAADGTEAAVAAPKAPADTIGTPVANHGALAVQGTDLVDAQGQAYQLKGISTHNLAWFPEYVNVDAFRTFRDDWGANLIRLALYTDENGGYCVGGDQASLEAVLDRGVQAATELGMYVIIDWHILHDLTPVKYQDQAESFFDRVAAKYANYDNVLYEICNEPNGGTSWSEVKGYAEDIIPIIRKHAPNAVIVIGTPTWSQDVDQAAADPITSADNLMYTLHFYAATHKDDLRNKLVAARNAGLPIFISEFSICDASGNGGIDYASAEAWKELIRKYNLSYAGWNLSNKNESSALLNPSNTATNGGWTDSDLSETGLWLKGLMEEY